MIGCLAPEPEEADEETVSVEPGAAQVQSDYNKPDVVPSTKATGEVTTSEQVEAAVRQSPGPGEA